MLCWCAQVPCTPAPSHNLPQSVQVRLHSTTHCQGLFFDTIPFFGLRSLSVAAACSPWQHCFPPHDLTCFEQLCISHEVAGVQEAELPIASQRPPWVRGQPPDLSSQVEALKRKL